MCKFLRVVSCVKLVHMPGRFAEGGGAAKAIADVNRHRTRYIMADKVNINVVLHITSTLR